MRVVKKTIKEYKTFFPRTFKGGILKEQKDALLNALKNDDGRSKVIKLFGDKNIKPNDYSHNTESEPEEYDEVEEFKPGKYEESIGEKIKMRRQNKSEEKNTVDELNKLLTEKHKIINKELFKKY